jgi:hypothetical protein
MARHLILTLKGPLAAYGAEMVDARGPVRDWPGASLLTGLLKRHGLHPRSTWRANQHPNAGTQPREPTTIPAWVEPVQVAVTTVSKKTPRSSSWQANSSAKLA